MSNTRIFQRSFGSGEISPEMFGRLDDSKFQTGAAMMRNFLAQPQGTVKNRAGFKMVRQVKESDERVRIIPFTFNTTQTMVIEIGEGYFRFHTRGATLVNEDGTPYEVANPFKQSDLFDIHYVQSADVLTMVHPHHPPSELRRLGALQWEFKAINFKAPLAAPQELVLTRYVPPSSKVSQDTYEDNIYVVTSLAKDGIGESTPSKEIGVSTNIYIQGAKNTLQWKSVPEAARYNVYKKQAGIFCFIGTTQDLNFVDNNIQPDASITPPTYDEVFESVNHYPSAVSYFEQRRMFAGTLNEPQKFWLTKSGTESDMSYGLPLRDNDRIALQVAAREASAIKHIVPLAQLLLLTESSEWLVSSVNSDAITPTTISVRPQSYIGASNVQPVIVNNTAIYAESRGGHLREIGYNWQSNGFVTSDLTLRSSHLFDGKEIVDMAYTKAPNPIIWAVSSNGMLLGVTYIPEQQVSAIHRHDTDGVFESVAVVSEGFEDVLYVVTKRFINGKFVRFIECMQTRQISDVKDSFFVDCGLSYEGYNRTETTITIQDNAEEDGGNLTITASSPLFSYPEQTERGDAFFIYDETGTKFVFHILEMKSKTVAIARCDHALPESFKNTPIKDYWFARKKMLGLEHLEGKRVSILTDGAVHPEQVVKNGAVRLNYASGVVHVGLPYVSELETLPIALQMDGFGQGRQKNINRVWLRVYQSSGLWVGPLKGKLSEYKQRSIEPYGFPPELKSQEIEVAILGQWGDSGQVFVRQKDPLPLTIVSMTLEVSIGG
ncbi:hypothetical protein [Bartonella queenslandensis]|uniref:hypothetical protein n=1 Tax=Bartonella queenslandensis TaxID=481138 RepID=UPI0002D815F7|nr:hypothetical protein [Bartonella queenslandensis]